MHASRLPTGLDLLLDAAGYTEAVQYTPPQAQSACPDPDPYERNNLLSPSLTFTDDSPLIPLVDTSDPESDFAATTPSSKRKRSPSPYFPASGPNSPVNTMRRYQKKRAQTALSCVRCRTTHKKCDESRPCKRCVRVGQTDCIDAPPRGRTGAVRRSSSPAASPKGHRHLPASSRPNTGNRYSPKHVDFLLPPLGTPSTPHLLPALPIASSSYRLDGRLPPMYPARSMPIGRLYHTESPHQVDPVMFPAMDKRIPGVRLFEPYVPYRHDMRFVHPMYEQRALVSNPRRSPPHTDGQESTSPQQ